MITIGATEATEQFAELLKKVENGETVTITRDGTPVATMIGAATETFKSDADETRRALDDIAELSKHMSLGGCTIRELIEEGRRY